MIKTYQRGVKFNLQKQINQALNSSKLSKREKLSRISSLVNKSTLSNRKKNEVLRAAKNSIKRRRR